MKLMIDIDARAWNDVVMGYMPGSKALLMGVSAEEVIPCKDCKYFIDGNGCILKGADYTWEEKMEAEDFCSKGEKR